MPETPVCTPSMHTLYAFQTKNYPIFVRLYEDVKYVTSASPLPLDGSLLQSPTNIPAVLSVTNLLSVICALFL